MREWTLDSCVCRCRNLWKDNLECVITTCVQQAQYPLQRLLLVKTKWEPSQRNRIIGVCSLSHSFHSATLALCPLQEVAQSTNRWQCVAQVILLYFICVSETAIMYGYLCTATQQGLVTHWQCWHSAGWAVSGHSIPIIFGDHTIRVACQSCCTTEIVCISLFFGHTAQDSLLPTSHSIEASHRQENDTSLYLGHPSNGLYRLCSYNGVYRSRLG